MKSTSRAGRLLFDSALLVLAARSLVRPALSVAVAASLLNSAHGAQKTWLGNTSGNMTDGANWVGGVAPVSNTDGIVLDAAGSAGTSLTLNSNIQYTDAAGAIVFNSGAPAYTLGGTGTITLGTGSVVNNSALAQTINNNLQRNTSSSMTIGASGGSIVLNGSYNYASNAGLTANNVAFGATQGGSVLFNGNLINTNGTPGSALLSVSASTNGSGTVVLGGNNTAFNVAGSVVRLGNNITLKASSVNAFGSSASIDIASAAANPAVWLANDAAMSNFALNLTTNTAPASMRVILDRATAGTAYTQNATFTSIGQQAQITVQKGSLVTGGNALVDASGSTTTFGNSGSAKTNVIVARDVNVKLGNVSAAGGSSTAGIGTTLVLDGGASGSSVTGTIANGAGTGNITTTVTGTSGSNVITLGATANVAIGQSVSGTGIAAGAYIIALAGSNATLSANNTSAVSGNGAFAVGNHASVNKAGSGTWSLSGANTYTGYTAVNGGTLNLDFANASVTSDILYNGATFVGQARPNVYLGGGNLQLTGKAGTANSQNVTALIAQGNTNSKVTLTAGSGGSTTLNVSTLTVNLAAHVDFNIGAGSTLNVSGATANSFVSSVATFGGTEFARYDASKNIVAAVNANYTGAANATLTGGLSSYYYLDGSLTRGAGLDLQMKGLRLGSTGNGDSLNLNGGNITISNSGLLYKGGGDNAYSITNGTIRTTTSATTLDVYTNTGTTLTVGAEIANNGVNATTIQKTGAGTLVVSGAKAYTGKTVILEGVYSTDSLANGGVASGIGASTNASGNLTLGATLRYTGSGASTDRNFNIAATGATIDASGTGALVWAPVGNATYANGNNAGATAFGIQSQSLTLTGNNTGANTFGGGTGVLADTSTNLGLLVLTKSGTGKWILAGANTYSGGTYINGGTLGVTATETAGVSGALGKAGDIVFGGGSLQFSATNTADYSSRIRQSTAAISIDTNGQSVTFATPISSSNVAGLTKLGSGNLTLSSANAYTGVTTISAGTLVLAAAGDIAGSSGVVLGTQASQGTLDLTAKSAYTFASDKSVSGYGTINIGSGKTVTINGNLAPGNSPGIVNITGGLTLNGTTAMEIAGSGGVAGTDFDRVSITESLTWGGTLSITSFGGFNLDQAGTYDLFDFSAQSGSFASGAISVGGVALTIYNAGLNTWTASNGGGTFEYSFNLDTGVLGVSAIPEPSVLALSGAGLALVALVRRRVRRA